jgi:hypothetical protein
VALAAALALLLRPPCDLPVPNLWTLGALGIFAVGVWQYQLFTAQQAGGDAHGDQ